eukprot:862441_1
MSVNAIISWIAIVIQPHALLSHTNTHCGHSQIPSWNDLGYQPKTHNVNYDLTASDQTSSKRRLAKKSLKGSGFGKEVPIDYAEIETAHSPIRIWMDFHVMEEQERTKYHDDWLQSSSSSKAKVASIMKTAKRAMSPIINYFQDHFSVQSGPVRGSLPIDYDWIEAFRKWHPGSYSLLSTFTLNQWKNSHPYAEVECDIIIYVINDDGAPCGPDSGTLAWALPMNRDQFGRPIDGIVNLCNIELQHALDGNYIESVNTLLHEFAHVMLVSDDNFHHFRYHQYSDIIKYGDNGHIFLQTPMVKQVVQDFYGCYDDSILPGMPIENQGPDSTRLTHWDERFALTSLMTGISYQDLVRVSPFFYAIAVDSGWYHVRMEDAGAYRFGYKQGCDFFTKPCIDETSQTTNWPQLFCDGADEQSSVSGNVHKHGCTADGVSIATCETVFTSHRGVGRIKEAEIVTEPDGTVNGYQQNWFGGSDLNNHCPFYDAIGDDQPQLCMLDDNDFHSRCVEYQGVDGKQRGECFSVDCSEPEWDDKHTARFGKISIVVGEDVVSCSRQQSEKREQINVNLNGDTISIICPSIDLYCPNAKPFECEFGSYDAIKSCCMCQPGYHGPRCDVRDDCIITDDESIIEDANEERSCKNRERLCGMHHGAQSYHPWDVVETKRKPQHDVTLAMEEPSTYE